tara:strand:- start:2738 stop:2986 length:249 start_codon:yes stop_codon:yes gene_type:complete
MNIFSFLLKLDFKDSLPLGVMTEVDVLAFIAKVEEGDPVLQVTDLVADRNPVGRTENAVLEGFVKDGDFFEHFCFIHKYKVN